MQGSLDAPLIGVVIPAFNAEAFLAQTVQSVLDQTHTNLELVIVDDGSSDRTLAIAKSYEDQRVTVLTGVNAGVASARNRGFLSTKGDYVAFLDADDCWAPDKLTRQVQFLEANPELGAVGTFMRYVAPNDRPLGIAGERLGSDARQKVAQARLMPFPLSSILFRRSVLEAVGVFDESLNHTATEDLDLLAKVAGLVPLGVIPDVLGAYRVHPASASVSTVKGQQLAKRFVRARLEARREGRDLSWEEFRRTHRRTFHQLRGDVAQQLFRSAGLAYTEERRLVSMLRLLGAVFVAPVYTLRRLKRQQTTSR